MPKFVRRQPLTERIKAALDPYDFLLWLSEEVDSHGWDQLEKEWAIPISFAFNFVFLVARANSKGTTGTYDDVFAESRGSGWGVWLVSRTLSLAIQALHCRLKPFRHPLQSTSWPSFRF